MTGIYCITNKVNGKKYVGQSRDICKRWQSHIRHILNSNDKEGNSTFYKEIRDVGIDNITFEILELCEEKDLDEKENFYIKKLNTRINGYNITGEYQDDMVSGIVYLLKYTEKSFKEISLIFNISENIVKNINKGIIYKKEEEFYPLR